MPCTDTPSLTACQRQLSAAVHTAIPSGEPAAGRCQRDPFISRIEAVLQTVMRIQRGPCSGIGGTVRCASKGRHTYTPSSVQRRSHPRHEFQRKTLGTCCTCALSLCNHGERCAPCTVHVALAAARVQRCQLDISGYKSAATGLCFVEAVPHLGPN